MSNLSNRRTPLDRSTDKIIGSNLLALRIQSGLSQSALATAGGVSFQQVQKYEQGVNSVRPANMLRFAKVLNCRVDDFFTGTSGEEVESAWIRFKKSSDVRILHAFHAIASQKQRLALLRLAQAMAETEQVETVG
jgi:transcriptional regulator with XRE-family HTH domain